MHLINVIVFQKFRTQTSQDFSRHTFRKTNMGECVLGKLPFLTPTAGSLQSWDRRVRPRLV